MKKFPLFKNVDFSLKKYAAFAVVLLFFGALFAQEITTLTINNAQQTEYKKNEETGNDSIVLTGAVEISISKGSVSSKIKADKISYDRKTEMLLAEGNVEISTSGGSGGGENATASSLLMNTATLEGVFADGRVVQTQSDAINLPSGSTLIVFSDIFGKTESNTIAFKNSSLTFCDDENPHWHIDASRTWLLPGGEFAFLNAVLYVGPVPVLYFPAFYYPKDELVFNPVFGYKERAGYYFQTTTYLYGRKPLDSGNSSAGADDDALAGLYNFMKPGGLKKQELQGLVLHNLDEDFSGDTSHYVKIMADIYSTLGAMIGVDGVLSPSKDYITSLKFNFDLGFSNTIFTGNGTYLPISSAGQKYWDKSNFLGLKLPFRYGGNLEMTLSKPFKLNLSLPVYSDPYFNSDFKNRKESLDWISLFMNSDSSDDTSVSEFSSYAWKLSASYSPTIQGILKQYISTASISLNSSLNISSATNTAISTDERSQKNDGWSRSSPERKFYYPSQITPASVTMSLNGTLYQYPPASQNPEKVTFPVKLYKPDELKTPAEKEAELKALQAQSEKENNNAVQKTDATKDDKKEELPEVKPVLPEITTNIPAVTNISGLNYKLTYSFNPTLNTQVSYDTAKSPELFKWNDIKSFMYTIRAPLSLNSNLNFRGNFLSMANKVSYDPIWQKHPNVSGYTGTQKDSLIISDYNAESQDIISSNSISFRPFIYIPVISETGISWNSAMKLFRRKFIGDAENPEWEDYALDFTDPDSFTTHSLDFTFSAKENESRFTQRFTYSTTLAPQLPRHSFSMNLGFPYVSASFGTSFQQTSLTDKTMIYNPFQQSINVSLFDSSLSLSESWNWNYQEKHNDSLKFSLGWKGLSASYIMSYTYGYDFDNDAGWIAKTSKEFLPYSLSLSYSAKTKEYKFFSDKVHLTPGVSTSVVADLIRPTNSYFIISPSITFKINDFFDLTFSSTSRNSVLYRYFQTALGHDGRIPGEQNPFIDLMNSFRFDDKAKRQASGFKLKSLNMAITHELHDWDFSFSMKFEPRMVTKNGVKYYDYSPFVSLGIFWRPMSSVKTEIKDEYGTLLLNE